jgi:hypothetical protein
MPKEFQEGLTDKEKEELLTILEEQGKTKWFKKMERTHGNTTDFKSTFYKQRRTRENIEVSTFKSIDKSTSKI